MKRVVVTGLGVISPLGNTPADLFAKLMAAESGVRMLTLNTAHGPYTHIGAPAVFDPASYFLPARANNLDRGTQLALVAAATAFTDAGIQLKNNDQYRAGVSIGVGMGAVHTLEDSYAQLLVRDPNRMKPLTVLTAMNNAPAAHIAMAHQLGGPNLTFSCACASSTIAIGEAYREIKHGYADVMIAGGAEAPLTFGVFKAWEGLRVLALADPANPAASCRPFSKNRSGLVLGEGAAMVVLEERERAMRRGAQIYGEVTGFGSANDASHLTKPSPQAQARVMTLALNDAGLQAHDIDYVNAHGSATPANDVTETCAIRAVFNTHAQRLPVSSTKSMHGHLLGAAGALEFMIALLAMRYQALPPTAHLAIPDPECDLDYVPDPGRSGVDVHHVMSNSFAFGGTNAVLIARRFVA